jgi:alkanesulfonate monooxygenase SsuD/methylene tetrahydromethanopterin reductase-like flavin-dependent oxidoreductase (luciferase family)
LIGDVETVAEKLVAEIRATHPVHLCFSFKVGATPHKAAMRSMELMMREVRPRVERALGQRAHLAAERGDKQHWGGRNMEIGAAIFFTDFSMAPIDLAVALEERGFDSLWVAEHSHIPVTRRFTHPLGDAALTKEYFDVMDPFVTLSAAAAVTTRLKLGTAICLVIQRDAIQTAKLVASLDQVSKGRFLFGIG